MDCGDISCRRTFQKRIKDANPEWAAAVEHLEEGKPAGLDESFGMRRQLQRSEETRTAGSESAESGSADSGMSKRELMGMRRRPDGDIEISEEEWERHGEFNVPSCGACGGALKPNVVLFGDNLPPARNQEAARMMSSADSLLVVGSSLMVLSAFRIASQCVQEGKPLALLAVGPNRADGIARIKIEARCGEVRCGEVRCGEVRCGEVRCGEVRCGEVRCAEVRCGEVRCAEVRCGEVRCGEVRCGEVRCGEVRCGEVRCAEVRCAEVRCGEVRCAEVRCGEVGSHDYPCFGWGRKSLVKRMF
ncbi:unnamed protein product [Closterium sp. Naga37s-1]|nr:unnamed protein product [Closterium sp. Naga37s-1]